MQVARRADMSTLQPLPVDKAQCSCTAAKVMTRCVNIRDMVGAINTVKT